MGILNKFVLFWIGFPLVSSSVLVARSPSVEPQSPDTSTGGNSSGKVSSNNSLKTNSSGKSCFSTISSERGGAGSAKSQDEHASDASGCFSTVSSEPSQRGTASDASGCFSTVSSEPSQRGTASGASGCFSTVSEEARSRSNSGADNPPRIRPSTIGTSNQSQVGSSSVEKPCSLPKPYIEFDDKISEGSRVKIRCPTSGNVQQLKYECSSDGKIKTINSTDVIRKLMHKVGTAGAPIKDQKGKILDQWWVTFPNDSELKQLPFVRIILPSSWLELQYLDGQHIFFHFEGERQFYYECDDASNVHLVFPGQGGICKGIKDDQYRVQIRTEKETKATVLVPKKDLRLPKPYIEFVDRVSQGSRVKIRCPTSFDRQKLKCERRSDGKVKSIFSNEDMIRKLMLKVGTAGAPIKDKGEILDQRWVTFPDDPDLSFVRIILPSSWLELQYLDGQYLMIHFEGQRQSYHECDDASIVHTVSPGQEGICRGIHKDEQYLVEIRTENDKKAATVLVPKKDVRLPVQAVVHAMQVRSPGAKLGLKVYEQDLTLKEVRDDYWASLHTRLDKYIDWRFVMVNSQSVQNVKEFCDAAGDPKTFTLVQEPTKIHQAKGKPRLAFC